MEPKHVAKSIYYWLYIDVVLWLNKLLYEILFFFLSISLFFLISSFHILNEL